EVAENLKRNTRRVDIVSRYGGEEFAVILPDTDLEGAKIVAEKIRQEMENTQILSEDTNEIMKVTLSAGVCTLAPNIDKGSLIKYSDEALYRAKREGKNKICVYK
ncbi:MAG: GGDEF domain-containing protein, partial [Candidatus Omnitrophica bacterium]|nr:GGDEF domain-containing protein [Candidatus Omnitrophota bacterium]